MIVTVNGKDFEIVENANLTGANLTGVDFTGADDDLFAADFTGANLIHANMCNAIFYDNLKNANMTCARNYKEFSWETYYNV